MKPRFDLSLYLLTDRRLSGPRGIAATVAAAVAGGATLVQLRDREATTRDLVAAARELKALLAPLGIPLIVNDRVDVALAADADGVHVGQSDMAVADARRLIGEGRILGLSITAPADLDGADLSGVDYLGVGPIYATATKGDAALPMGLAGLRAVAARTRLPIVAIGGLDAGNAADVVRAGAAGVAVVSAIAAAPDPRAAAAAIRAAVEAARR
ncbi:MAG: thiamine phosphate synthase [Bauldia sp.]